MATNLLYALVGVVGIKFAGELGSSAVAAVGVGLQIFYGFQTILLAISAGTTALVARSWGAGERDEAIRIVLASLVVGCGFGVLIAIPGILFAPQIASIFGLDEQTAALSAEFIVWLSVFNVTFAVNFVMAAALRAAGDAKTPLWIACCINVVNIILLYPIMFGFGPIPPQGVAGMALAAGISFSLAALLTFWLWFRNQLCIKFRWLKFMERKRLADLLHVSYPAGIEQVVFRIGFFGFTILIARFYGTVPFAAYNIGVNLLSLCFVVGFGFSIAGATLVGQLLGRRDPEGAERSALRALKYAIFSMTLIGLVIVGLAEPIARLLVDDEEVIKHAVTFIYILGAVQPLMAIEFALGGALRGAGDTRFPLKTTLVGLIGVRLAFAALATSIGLPVVWVYAALIGDYLVKAAMLVTRFRGGRWKTVLDNRLH